MDKFEQARQMLKPPAGEKNFLHRMREDIQERMSSCGAHIRHPEKIKEAIKQAWSLYARLKKESKVASSEELPDAFKNLDLGLTHALYLEAIGEYLEKGGKSRGSYLVVDTDGDKPCEALGDEWKFSLNQEDAFVSQRILEIHLDENLNVKKQWVDIRALPHEEAWFENVWNEYLEDKIIK